MHRHLMKIKMNSNIGKETETEIVEAAAGRGLLGGSVVNVTVILILEWERIIQSKMEYI